MDTSLSRLCYDDAHDMESDEDLCATYNLTPLQLESLRKTPQYREQYRRFATEIQQRGTTFRIKAQLAAEELLVDAFQMAKTSTTPAAVRLDAMKWLANVAGLSEAKDKAATAPTIPVQININL